MWFSSHGVSAHGPPRQTADSDRRSPAAPPGQIVETVSATAAGHQVDDLSFEPWAPTLCLMRLSMHDKNKPRLIRGNVLGESRAGGGRRMGGVICPPSPPPLLPLLPLPPLPPLLPLPRQAHLRTLLLPQ